jgi:hypothetical protein
MTSRFFLVVLMIACMGGTAWAGKRMVDSGKDLMIADVSAVSITVTAGRSGTAPQETYKIADSTKIILNGLHATPDDLMAGMFARITLAADNQTARIISARAASRGHKK